MMSAAITPRTVPVALPGHRKHIPVTNATASTAASTASATDARAGTYTPPAPAARRAKRKLDPPMKQFTRWLVQNQTGLAANLFALIFLAHSIFPRLRTHTVKFFTLSYYNPSTGNYDIGHDDAYLVLFLVVLFTGLRASTMDYILAPYARSQGLCRKKPITRFSEQAWLMIVYTVFLPFGIYLYYNSPYFFSLKNLWTHWPGREMTGLLKTYILIQLAFWLQQIIVINIEDRRKDHWQMLTHHFVTVSLLSASYRYRHTPVANVILILMDTSDFFLPLAKCQKYLGYTNICDVTFGAFMLSWFICRHVFFTMVCYSVWSQTPVIMPEGCFKGVAAAGAPAGAMRLDADTSSAVIVPVAVAADEISSLTPTITSLLPLLSESTSNKIAFLVEPLVRADGAVCYNSTVKWVFLSMLLFLQLMIIVWFFMIVQVAIRVVRGVGAEDTRSDDEDDEDEEEEEKQGDAQGHGDDSSGEESKAKAVAIDTDIPPLEEEVGVEAIDLKGWERRAGVKRQMSTTTAVSLPGHHSDRKDLLGRIGCEKQVE